jgi:hypothetical protein
MPWIYRLLDRHRDKVFQKRANLQEWWERIKQRHSFVDLQRWAKRIWPEEDCFVLNDGAEDNQEITFVDRRFRYLL